MSLWDFPVFIIDDLSTGPYGPEVSAKIAYIHSLYEMYYTGSGFSPDIPQDGEPDPTIWKSRKIKRLIDEQAEFMVGNTPEIRVECGDHDDQCSNQSDMQDYLDAVLKKNNFASKLIRGARDCFIGGRVFLKVNVLPDKITIMFIPADNFLYFTEPDDVDTLSSVILFYCTRESEDRHLQRWWRQRYRMDGGKCYVRETLYDGYGNVIDGYGSDERDTGLSRIPGYVILNEGLSGDTEGESDILMISDDDSVYNEMRSRNSDSIKRNMNPMKYIIGASPKSMDRLSTKPGAINDITPDPVLKGTLPQVGCLESSFGFNESYQETLKSINSEMLYNLGIPDVSAAVTSGLVTSGKGLKALYWSLISRCNGKWAVWKPALEAMADIIIDAAATFPQLKDVYGFFESETYTVTIEPNYALPEDEETERELDLREVGTSRSVKSYLMKWGGADYRGLTADQADAEIEQMAKEKRMFEDAVVGEMSGVDFGV